MGISGNLKTMVLAELLQWLSMGQKTGTLVIDNGAVEKRIVFGDGAITASASTDPKEHLGRFLINHGYVPEEQVEKALAKQKKEKQLLGKILVELGAIDEEDVHQVLRLKAEESLFDIFTWGEGDFEFLDNEVPEDSMISMALDVQGLVLEGSRRVDEWKRIRELVPSPQVVPVAVCDLQALEIDEIDLRILEWIDDDRTVEEISQGSETSLFQVASTIAAQVREGTVKAVRPRTVEVKVEVPVEAPPAGEAETPAPAADLQAADFQPTLPSSAAPVDLGGGRQLRFAASPAAAAEAAPPPAAAAAPAPTLSDAETLVQQAGDHLRRGDLEDALAKFRKARSAPGCNEEVEKAVTAGEEKIREALENAGIRMNTVPRLKCAMEELTKLSISPQEGFVLTRVDGSYDIRSILKMSPIPPVDAQMLFWRLKKLGHVAV